MKNLTTQPVYAYGAETVLEKDLKKTLFQNRFDCVKKAVEAGYSFIMEYHPNGNKTLIGWNIDLMRKKDILERYWNNGDKMSLLRAYPRTNLWIIAPIEDHHPLLIPIDKKVITSFKKVMLHDLLEA